MSRLNDENFETILSGQEPMPPEAVGDSELARRLATHRALKNRLQRAFDRVKLDASFTAQLRERLTLATRGGAVKIPLRRRRVSAGRGVRLRRMLWPALAAAALLTATAIPLSVLLYQQPVMAAQKEFAAIHRGHESAGPHMMQTGDVTEMTTYLRSKLGYEPGTPRLGPEDKACGCCVDRFLGEPVGSYLLKTPEGLISLIVARVDPESLKLRHRIERDGRTVWACAYGDCRIAGIRNGEVSYYVVGELPQDTLISLLLQIVPVAENQAKGS